MTAPPAIPMIVFFPSEVRFGAPLHVWVTLQGVPDAVGAGVGELAASISMAQSSRTASSGRTT